MRSLARVGALVFVAAITPVSAQEEPAPPSEPAHEEPAPPVAEEPPADQPVRESGIFEGWDRPPPRETGPAPEPDSEPKKAKRKIAIGGRVFFRDTIDEIAGVWSNDVDLKSARLAVRYDNSSRDLRIEIEGEFAGTPRVRDGYLRVEATRYLRVKAGQFKRPIGSVALASRRELSVIERGLLTDLEQDGMKLPVGGRRPGLEVEVAPKLPLNPSFKAGLFEGQIRSTFGTRLDLDEGFSDDVYARAAIRPVLGVEVGLSGAVLAYAKEGGNDDSLATGGVGSLDATIDFGFVRAWVEGFIGTNPLATIPSGVMFVADGAFVAGRAIVGVPIPVPVIRAIEPYGSFQAIDLSSSTDRDRAYEVQGGVNVHFTGRYRLQTGFRRVEAQSILAALEQTAFIAQAAAFF